MLKKKLNKILCSQFQQNNTELTVKTRRGKISTINSSHLRGRLRRVGRRYHMKREKVAFTMLLGLMHKSSPMYRLNVLGRTNATGFVRRFLFASDERYLREKFHLGGPSFQKKGRMFPLGDIYTSDNSYSNPSSWGTSQFEMMPSLRLISIKSLPTQEDPGTSSCGKPRTHFQNTRVSELT